MEITEFRSALKSELLKRGITDDAAAAGIAGLTKTITEEKRVMIERISTPDDLSHFADALAKKIASEQKEAENKKAAVRQSGAQNASGVRAPQPKAQQSGTKPTVQPRPAQSPSVQPTAQFTAQSKSAPRSAVGTVPVSQSRPRPSAQPNRQPARQTAGKTAGMDKGDKIFLAVLIIGAPLWLLGICIVSIPLAVCYAGIVIMIAACILLLIGVAAAGVSVSLVGLVYGIIKLFTVRPEGAYEIGLAAVIGGFTMFVCILLYNLAVRYIPRLFPIARQLLSFEAEKITDFYYYVKKVCHNI